MPSSEGGTDKKFKKYTCSKVMVKWFTMVISIISYEKLDERRA